MNNLQLRKTRLPALLLVMTLAVMLISPLATTIRAAGETVDYIHLPIRYTGTTTTRDYASGQTYTTHAGDAVVSYIAWLDGAYHRAFCIEPGVDPVRQSGHTIAQTNPVYDAVAVGRLNKIIYHGYDKHNTDYDWLATQFYIWDNWSTSGEIDNPYNGMADYGARKAAIDQAVAGHDTVADFAGRTVQVIRGETLTLTDANKTLAEATVLHNAGFDVRINQADNTVRITPGADSPRTGTVRIQKFGKLAWQQATSPWFFMNPNSQDVVVGGRVDPVFFDVTVQVLDFGTLVINKQSEANDPVAGATFDLARDAEMTDVIHSCTTGADGRCTLTDLIEGTYYLKETAVPAGYRLSPTVRPVTVRPQEITTQTITNDFLEHRLAIRKLNQTRQPVQGAVFEVADNAQFSGAKRVSTGPDGWYRETGGGVAARTYHVREHRVPAPLIRNATPQTGTVDAGETLSLTFTNAPAKGQIRVVKVDQQDRGIADATFAVLNEDGAAVANLTTDSSGMATTAALPLGTYQVVEMRVPEPYVADPKPRTVTLSYVNQNTPVVVQQLKIVNNFKPHALTIQKLDERDQPVHGAIFEIADNARFKNARRVTTGPDGCYQETGEGVASRTFHVREVFVPAPLILDQTPRQGTVSAGNTLTFQFKNADAVGMISINKATAAGKPLKGAIFEVRDASDKVVATLATADDGSAKTGNLPLGDYTVAEVSVPAGYVLDPAPKPVRLTYQNMDTPVVQTTVRAANKIQRAPFTLKKSDVVTGAAQGDASLAGAVYDVVVVSTLLPPSETGLKPGDLAQTVTTGKNGMVKTKDLPLGVYDLVEKKASPGYQLNRVAVRVQSLQGEPDQAISNQVVQLSANDRNLIEIHNAAIDELNIVNKQNNPETYVPIPHIKAKPGNNPATMHVYELVNYGRISVTKHIQDPDAGSGARVPEENIRFEIRNTARKVVDTLVTDAAGRGSSGWLPPGTYTVTQLNSTPKTRRADPFNVTISGSKPYAEYQYNLANALPKFYLKIQKTDAETKKTVPVAGATFEILNEDGQVMTLKQYAPEYLELTRFVTNEKGHVTLPERLPLGKYSLREVAPPPGYTLAEADLDFTMTADNLGAIVVTVQFMNVPQKGQLEIQKRGPQITAWLKNDKGVMVPRIETKYLSGVSFELRAKTDIVTGDGTVAYKANELVETLETTDTGPVKSQELPLGQYVLKERQAPAGYLPDPTSYDIAFTELEPTKRIDLKIQALVNERKDVTFTFVKAFETSEWFNSHENAAEKASFGLYNKQAITEHGVSLPKDSLIGISSLKKSGGTYTGSFKNIPVDGTFYIKELSTAETYLLSEDTPEVTASFARQAAKTATVGVQEPIKNELNKFDLKVIKVDQERRIAIPNVTFKLVSIKAGQEILEKTYVTDQAGTLTVRGLETGSYYLQEVRPASGYRPDNTKYELHPGESIDLKTKKATVKIYNRPTEVTVSKQRAGGAAELPGAELEIIEQASGRTVKTWTSSDQPAAVKYLEIGKTYILRENRAPSGHVKAPDMKFSLNADGTAGPITMKNKPYPDVIIEKTQITDGAPVERAEIVVSNKDGKEVHRGLTDARGNIGIKNLAPGEYTFKEARSPRGYVSNNQTFNFTVDAFGNVHGITRFSNDPTELQLKKIDGATHEPLTDVEFEIRSSSGEPVHFDLEAGIYMARAAGKITRLLTNRHGLIQVRGLPVGQYRIVETRPLTGYNFIADLLLDLKADAGTQNPQFVELANYPQATITKTDITSGEPVPQAEITVFDEHGQAVFKGTTDGQGACRIAALKPGSYTFKESVPPEGYRRNPEIHHFTVDDNGQVGGTTHFTDEPTELVITKMTAEDRTPLVGVGIEICAADGTPLRFRLDDGRYVAQADGSCRQLLTDQNGVIVVRHLPQGAYTVVETGVPEGYQQLADTRFIITDQTGVSTPARLQLLNVRVLPQTGEQWSPVAPVAAGSCLLLALILIALRICRQRKGCEE